jgi:DUF1365 family protein
VTLCSALYDGDVVHERRTPKLHRLRYSVFSMLFDLDELAQLDRSLRLFGYNRRAPVTFHDADHGPHTGEPLRPWAESKMRAAGVTPDGGRIALLCYPRLFGYVFNPLSVYFCYRKDGTPAAILYEVRNTHGEQHTYALAVTGQDGSVVRQSAEKAFYVSPFIGPTATYNFRIIPPGDTVSVVIRQETAGEFLMAASFRGTRAPLTSATLARRVLLFPLMTLKIIAAIHWEAAKMWWKGFEIFPHTPHAAGIQRPGRRP